MLLRCLRGSNTARQGVHMKLSKIAATAAMTGALGSAALGIGAGFAQADPDGPNPGPNVPGPNVPGPNVPDRDGPGQGSGGRAADL